MCVCARARARERADPIILVFVTCVECGFLCVYNVMSELFDSMYLNIVVIVMCFVARIILSLSINAFICI